MSPPGERLAAINPLQWPAFDQVAAPAWREMLDDLAGLGFAAVHLQASDPDSALAELALLSSHGLQPAPGYWEVKAQRGGPTAAQRAEACRAIDAHASVGLDAMFIACAMEDERQSHPHRYNDAVMDADRLAWIAELFESVGEYAARVGVSVCVHQHVATTIQSPQELEAVLRATDPRHVMLGPDSGHMAWAGIDAVEVLQSHAPRVRAMHLKDVRLDLADRAERDGWTYEQSERGGVWASPGIGSLDLAGIVAAAPPSLRWMIAEVDHDPHASPLQSSRLCHRWLADNWLSAERTGS